MSSVIRRFNEKKTKSNFKKAIASRDWNKLLIMLKAASTHDLKESKKTGETLLHRVCCYDPPLDVVQRLYSLSPEMIRKPDVFGRLPLHSACRFNVSPQVTSFLTLSYMAGIYGQDKLGKTPLHYAVGPGFGYQKMQADVIVSLSISAPHMLLCPDGRGETPLDILDKRSGAEVQALLDILRPLANSSSYTKQSECLSPSHTATSDWSTEHKKLKIHRLRISSLVSSRKLLVYQERGDQDSGREDSDRCKQREITESFN